MDNRVVENLPKARRERLVVKELPNETLVYDLDTDKAHCLNSTAAVIWQKCDGKLDVSEIAETLRREGEAPVDESAVWLALEQLEKFKLLDYGPTKPAHLSGMSRRQVVRKLGLAGLAIPAIISIAAPTPAEAQSCLPNNAQCTLTGPPCCAPQLCLVHPSGFRCQ